MRYDCIMPLGDGSRHDNLEARIAVASLRKFFRGLGRIVIVGEDPGIDGVEVVRCPEPGAATKDGNIIGKIMRGLLSVPDISREFLFISDDILITEPSRWSDFRPRYVSEYPTGLLWRSERMRRTWERRLLMTMEKFGPGARFFEPHIFSPMSRDAFLRMCGEYDWMGDEGVICQSLYYNYVGERGVPVLDHALIREPRPLPAGVRHISYTDRAFDSPTFRNQLRRIVSL